MRPGTAWAWKSARTLGCHQRPWVNWTLVCRSPSSPGSTSRAGAESASRTHSSSPRGGRRARATHHHDQGTARPLAAVRRVPFGPRSSTLRRSATVAIHQRPQERPRAQPRRPALDRHRVPARQARQGPRLRADHAEERAVRQGRRQDLQRRHQGRDGHRRQARHEVPVQGRRRLRLHGRRHLRPDPRPREDRRRRRQLPAGEPEAIVASTRACRSTSSCRPRSSWSSRTPSPGLQGDRSTGGTKPATLETGAEIQVPLFLTTGEKIKVDTRDGRYLGRVNS